MRLKIKICRWVWDIVFRHTVPGVYIHNLNYACVGYKSNDIMRSTRNWCIMMINQGNCMPKTMSIYKHHWHIFKEDVRPSCKLIIWGPKCKHFLNLLVCLPKLTNLLSKDKKVKNMKFYVLFCMKTMHTRTEQYAF